METGRSSPDPSVGLLPSARTLARRALRDDEKLSPAAKLVWLILDTRGDDPRPSRATLARNCGVGPATVKRALRELEAAAWLRVVRRTSEDGDPDTNRYELVCPEDEVGSPREVPPGMTPGGVISEGGVTSAGTPQDDPTVGLEETPGVGSSQTPEGRTTSKNFKNNPSDRRSAANGAGSGDDPEWLKFWAVYPRKVAKPAALKAWRAKIKAGASPDVIIDAAAAYADERQADRRPGSRNFTAHPATWLNQERFADDDKPDNSQGGCPRCRGDHIPGDPCPDRYTVCADSSRPPHPPGGLCRETPR
jgi:hypothetical protein